MSAPKRSQPKRRLRDQVAPFSGIERLVELGCDRDTLDEWLRVLSRPGRHRADWYHLEGFPPDKLRRFPRQLKDRAGKIEKLSKIIAHDRVYQEAVVFLSHHPALKQMGPGWFEASFGNLPDLIRGYAAAISHIQFAVQHFARRAAKRGRTWIGPEALIYYVCLATKKPRYEYVADMLNEARSKRFGEIDAVALRKRFERSEFAEKIKQFRIVNFRNWLRGARSD